MLHAFNSKTGAERFAYVPNEVYDKLAVLSDPKYGCKGTGCLPHEYLVDGTASVSDAYIAGSWRTVLVGTLGLGGKGIFALDVTEPESFNKDKVMWEISSRQATVDPGNASVYADYLGNSLPASRVVRLKNGDWAAVVANGYNSAKQTAALFLINMVDGKLIKQFVVPAVANTKNGLSTPTPVDSDGDYIVDAIYAGDLLGNLWAFDVSDADPAKWSFKYGTSTAPKPLFKACKGLSCPPSQAITAAPQIGRHPAGGLMVYFGTGRYFDVSDNMFKGASPAVNTFYGIRDNGAEVTKDTLVQQTITHEISAATDLISRVTSSNTVDYASKKGWYMDLESPSNGAEGERVISQALLRGGRIIFTTMTPPQNQCVWGGKSWIMEFNAIDGKRLSVIPFDTNNDKQFTSDDNVTVNNASTIISGVQKPSLGVIFSTPAVITHTTRAEGKYVTGTGGSVGMFRESASRFSGRMSWRKLK
jgi:type IV pilus assembly protein PilY1